MGEPLRIADLAEDLIRLSGLEVGSDIEIAYTGIRPGEKLYEELFFGPDDATPTEHPKILRARDSMPSLEIDRHVEALIKAARNCDPEDTLRFRIRQLVPQYDHSSLHELPSLQNLDAPAMPHRTRVTREPAISQPLSVSTASLFEGTFQESPPAA
jgi:FlaA1/EpsC-like NDP-sugar epimerase